MQRTGYVFTAKLYQMIIRIKKIVLFLGLLITKAQSYDISYKNYAQKNKQETAVLVMAYNRPEYFAQCIKSLEQNPEHAHIPFIFALDGGPESTQKEHISLIKKSKLKHTIIVVRDRNYGCPKNHIDAYRFVFDWCKYKKMIMLQEDIVVTPTYITLMLNLHDWATKKYTNIGAVHGYSYCFLSPEEKKEHTAIVVEDSVFWLFRTFCMSSQTWNILKPIMYTYENFIDQIPWTNAYAKKRSKPGLWEDSYKIRDWIHKSLQHKTTKINKKETFLDSGYQAPFYKEFSSPRVYINEDNSMAYAFFMHDLVKIHTLVNRAISIGEYGLSEESSKEFALLENKISLDTIDQEHILKDFIYIKNKKYIYPETCPFISKNSKKLDAFLSDIYT